MQCGIASLSMICQYYGRKYSTSYLSEMCHATTEGVSMLGISETATQLVLIAMTAYVSPEDMLRKDVSLPAILHWKQNHFVVLYKIKHDAFYIADPGKGLIKYSYAEFIDNWTSTTVNDKEKGVAKILREPIASGVEHLAPESLAMILGGRATVEGTGGCSCGQTESSCGCDGTARCNCNPPIKHQVTTMQTLVHS